jgi:hypothetical protein
MPEAGSRTKLVLRQSHLWEDKRIAVVLGKDPGIF